ncbi:quinone oxidoreductase family protein [Pseudonocardia sp. HH130630-07]|uniref:quinone oxidoreductase family protein n=1 Tax=Pseudonocardia sp. HH130630-07 TaxID=1690815 RepID=UPI000814C7F0|nr:quinone oxidoreductase [Pseudonocardia sp. HH130630-07]ANY08988.1 NADPH:quinone reductase [Pseudonocardia sp. HH130630-07]
MRAVRVTKAGGPEVLEVADVDVPAPGPGEVLVEVAAAGVNYIDTYQREGIYPMPTPYTPGLEGAGRVTALGEGVSGVAAGDRIAWAETLGSYAEQVAVPWDKAVPVPDAVPDDVAVGSLLQGMTAHFLVNDTFPLSGGETVLVHAAAGGVGLLLTQLAAAKGARVIATTSSAEKAELARGAGAAEVIDYTRVDDLAAAVRELTGGEGVHAAFDSVGATTFDASLATLRKRGMLVLFGAASGPVPPVDPQRLNSAGSVFLTRPKLFDFVDTTAALRAKAAAVYSEVAAGRLDVRIGHRYPLEQARTAHEDLQGRRTTGKVLLLPS